MKDIIEFEFFDVSRFEVSIVSIPSSIVVLRLTFHLETSSAERYHQDCTSAHFEKCFERDIRYKREFEVHARGELCPVGKLAEDIKSPDAETLAKGYKNGPPFQNADDDDLNEDYLGNQDAIRIQAFVGNDPIPGDLLRNILLPSAYYVPKNVSIFYLFSIDFDVDVQFTLECLPTLRDHHEALERAYNAATVVE